MKQVLPRPVPERLTLWQKFLAMLPGRCSYCSKAYVSCNQGWDTFTFLPKNGKCCPDGHEGHVDQFIITGDILRHEFDYVKNPPKPVETGADEEKQG